MDKLADALWRSMSDPRNPANRLRRPAKRTCLNCGATWISRVALLADSQYCSDACEERYGDAIAAVLRDVIANNPNMA